MASADSNLPERPTILLVDDDEAFLSVFVQGLRTRGFEVIAARSDEEARSLIDDLPRIDVLVTDLNLGDGWGGQLAFAVKARNPDLPVIYISGYTEEDELLRFGVQGHMNFLGKPFSVAELADVVRKTLDEAVGGSEDANPEEEG